MKCRILLIFLCLAASAAPAGTLLTRDGQTLTGDLSLTESQITLKPTDGQPRTFALNDVVQATFAQPATAAAATIMGGSPTPLAPRGPATAGVSTYSMCIEGASAAVNSL